MAFPTPQAGLVIHFNYLWSRQAKAGRENADYARPCAIILTHHSVANGVEVVVAPITHSPPRDDVEAIEIPAAVKRHLGLDDERSWVIVNELNLFFWPGHDLEPNATGEIVYGTIPAPLFARIKSKVLEVIKRGGLSRIVR